MPPEHCTGRHANDLGWKDYEVAQCIKRYGDTHTKENPVCCRMFYA